MNIKCTASTFQYCYELISVYTKKRGTFPQFSAICIIISTTLGRKLASFLMSASIHFLARMYLPLWNVLYNLQDVLHGFEKSASGNYLVALKDVINITDVVGFL